MTTTADTTIEIIREFAVLRHKVHHRWTDAAAMARWFAPAGYSTVRAIADPRPGGHWELVFRSDDGHEYVEHGEYREVTPERIVLTLTQTDGDHNHPQTLVIVGLDDIGTTDSPRTRMRFLQSGYRSERLREDNQQGWLGCIEELGRDLGDPAALPDDERELRALFAEWFAASERKDLEASMAPIATDVVSYEHSIPQEYRDVEAVREVCAEGFGFQPDGFRWDVPDLHIEVSGDLAVTWGLNRMRALLPDGTVRTDWSRGTRVFQRRDGRWQMTHQHVSFPMDGEGRASTAPGHRP